MDAADEPMTAPEPASSADEAEVTAPADPERMSADEMVGLLGVMARQIAGDSPPVFRDASAVAAEVAASAARAAGPAAKVAAEATDDASTRLAERLEAYAAGVREQQALEAATQADATEADDEDPPEAS